MLNVGDCASAVASAGLMALNEYKEEIFDAIPGMENIMIKLSKFASGNVPQIVHLFGPTAS